MQTYVVDGVPATERKKYRETVNAFSTLPRKSSSRLIFSRFFAFSISNERTTRVNVGNYVALDETTLAENQRRRKKVWERMNFQPRFLIPWLAVRRFSRASGSVLVMFRFEWRLLNLHAARRFSDRRAFGADFRLNYRKTAAGPYLREERENFGFRDASGSAYVVLSGYVLFRCKVWFNFICTCGRSDVDATESCKVQRKNCCFDNSTMWYTPCNCQKIRI